MSNCNKTIPLSTPTINGNEWVYIKECLDTNWVSSVGSFVNRFEDELANYVDMDFAVAMSNGTAALHISLLVAGVMPDDEVIVPALTFISPVNTVRYVGATPVFMDVEPVYWQIDPQKLTDFINNECSYQNGQLRNNKTGKRIAAIIPVDLLGHPADMTPIAEIARKNNIRIIEDATESLGARYQNNHVGHFSDIACYSFNGNKVITTGGGGMLVTNNEKYAEKARYLSTQAKDDPLEYFHKEVGYNYRLTNIQAAMGCAQMEQLDFFIKQKRIIADFYRDKLASIPGITIPQEAEGAMSTFWLYTIKVDADVYGRSSRELLQFLLTKNIQTRPLWQPIYSLPPYKQYQAYNVDVADIVYRDALSIPSSSDLCREDQELVIEQIKSAQGK